MANKTGLGAMTNREAALVRAAAKGPKGPTGSTGFGQMTNRELRTIRAANSSSKRKLQRIPGKK